MILDVDNLIDLLKKINSKDKGGKKEEFDEQDAAPTGGAGASPTGGSGKAVPKWADTVGGPKRGKANMLGKGGEKWETGMTRGVANQIY